MRWLATDYLSLRRNNLSNTARIFANLHDLLLVSDGSEDRANPMRRLFPIYETVTSSGIEHLPPQLHRIDEN